MNRKYETLLKDTKVHIEANSVALKYHAKGTTMFIPLRSITEVDLYSEPETCCVIRRVDDTQINLRAGAEDLQTIANVCNVYQNLIKLIEDFEAGWVTELSVQETVDDEDHREA